MGVYHSSVSEEYLALFRIEFPLIYVLLVRDHVDVEHGLYPGRSFTQLSELITSCGFPSTNGKMCRT